MGLKEWLEDEYEDGRAAGIEEGRIEGIAAGIAEGKAAGIAEGKAAGIADLIRKTLAKGLSPKEIADLFDEDISAIQAIADSLKN